MAVVTVSRGAGSEGRLVAEGLAERLGYDLVGREDVVQSASRLGVPAERVEEALLEAPSFWERLSVNRERYLAFVQAALCERAEAGGIVYEGNAGHLLLHGVSHVACIRLLAPKSRRVSVAMERFQMGHEQAVRYVEESDQQREAWTRHLYGVDWLDASLYDVTINMRTLSVEGAIDVALAAVRRPEFEPTAPSRKAMADLLLESRVRAALASDPETATADVRVRADGGTVALRGRVRPESMVATVLEVVGKVDGVRSVDRRDLDAPAYTV
jgi:cytidylate kinase